MQNIKKILIVAGEASGDLHAANLVAEIKRINPQIRFFGLGGKKLQAQGVNLYCDIVDLAVVGIFEVIKNLSKFKQIFNGLLAEADKKKPDLAILVDYPGFNLRLAAELKKRNIPVIYFISPQIWAWGAKRIHEIKRNINLMIVVFKFEEELYKQHDMPVYFCGHPLLDIVGSKTNREQFLGELKLSKELKTIALLPGSREKEINNLLPVMMKTAENLYRRFNKEIQFIILRSPTVKEEIFNTIIKKYNVPVVVVSDNTYAGLISCDFAMVASGTATLETAILGVPMVILYKVSMLTYAFIKTVIKIPYIGLVNVVKKERFIEEFIQHGLKPDKIADYIYKTISDPIRLSDIKAGLAEVTSSLGEKGANRKAASAIIKFLEKE